MNFVCGNVSKVIYSGICNLVKSTYQEQEHKATNMKNKVLFIIAIVLIVCGGIGAYFWYQNNRENSYVDAATKFKWDAYVVKSLNEKVASDVSSTCACVIKHSVGFKYSKEGITTFKCSDISTAATLRIQHYKDMGIDKTINNYLKHMDSCLVVMEDCPEKYEKMNVYFQKTKENATKLYVQVFDLKGSYAFFSQNVGQLTSDIASNLKQTDLHVKDCQAAAEKRGNDLLGIMTLQDISFITYIGFTAYTMVAT